MGTNLSISPQRFVILYLQQSKFKSMGKGTNFSGQPVLSQLIKLMDRQKINTLASRTGSNRYVKHLDGYSHLVVMLYAVLCNLRSLREVCLGFEANATRMNHFGLDHMICRSTLSDANKRRSSSSLEASIACFSGNMPRFYRTAERNTRQQPGSSSWTPRR